MPFKISTTEKRGATEIVEWTKGKDTIVVTTTYRWGWVETDKMPDLLSYDPLSGTNVFTAFEVMNNELEDITDQEVYFSTSITEKMKKTITRFIANNSDNELDNIGWKASGYKIIFKGELRIESI